MSTFPPYFLFRLCHDAKKVPSGPLTLTPEFLGTEYEIPALWTFTPPASGRTPQKSLFNADANGSAEPGTPEFHFRLGWREDGLVLTVCLGGKRRPVYVNPTRLEASDSFSFYLDTRDVRDVHRGTKFCHRLLFLPVDSTSEARGGTARAVWLPIHRAKALPNPVDVSRFEIAYQPESDGWRLSAYIPGDTLTGYDPLEHNRIGFSFTLFDNEFGWMAMQLPEFFPSAEDPSLWAALNLTE